MKLSRGRALDRKQLEDFRKNGDGDLPKIGATK
jgi:hypothetical protein